MTFFFFCKNSKVWSGLICPFFRILSPVLCRLESQQMLNKALMGTTAVAQPPEGEQWVSISRINQKSK